MLAIIAMLALGATACKKSEPKQKMLDPMTKMVVLVKDGLKAKGAETISVEECMRRANALCYSDTEGFQPVMAILDHHKDYENNALKIEAMHIILDNGKLDPHLGTSRDFVLVDTRIPGDTLGYIPNKTVHKAYARAVQAYKEERYEDVVKIFTSAFVAYPCTGKQFREMKAKGLN